MSLTVRETPLSNCSCKPSDKTPEAMSGTGARDSLSLGNATAVPAVVEVPVQVATVVAGAAVELSALARACSLKRMLNRVFQANVAVARAAFVLIGVPEYLDVRPEPQRGLAAGNIAFARRLPD